jgi:hypothetical protein
VNQIVKPRPTTSITWGTCSSKTIIILVGDTIHQIPVIGQTTPSNTPAGSNLSVISFLCGYLYSAISSIELKYHIHKEERATNQRDWIKCRNHNRWYPNCNNSRRAIYESGIWFVGVQLHKNSF